MTALLIGENGKPTTGGFTPTLTTPEDWREFISARVMWYIHNKLRLPKATLVHKSCTQGTYSQAVVDSTPAHCQCAIYTIENLVMVEPQDSMVLWMRVCTGALVAVPIGWDANLPAAIDKNTQVAYDQLKHAFDQIAKTDLANCWATPASM